MFAFLRSRSAPPAVIDAPLLDTLADAHTAAEADADAAFTPERAAAQRAAILARLGAAADQRVLSFPPRAAEPAPRAGHPRAAPRARLDADRRGRRPRRRRRHRPGDLPRVAGARRRR